MSKYLRIYSFLVSLVLMFVTCSASEATTYSASGTYTYTSSTATLAATFTTNGSISYPGFPCNTGPDMGLNTFTGVTISATTMTWANSGNNGGGMTWTRSGSGTGIVGTWITTDPTGDTYTLTVTGTATSGTVSVTGNIISPSSVICIGAGTHTAMGAYTYSGTSPTATVTMNIGGDTDFICQGPHVGTNTMTGVSMTATTMTWPGASSNGGTLTWTRTSGTTGITGSWHANDGGNTADITFTGSTASGSVIMTATKVAPCYIINNGTGTDLTHNHWLSASIDDPQFSIASARLLYVASSVYAASGIPTAAMVGLDTGDLIAVSGVSKSGSGTGQRWQSWYDNGMNQPLTFAWQQANFPPLPATYILTINHTNGTASSIPITYTTKLDDHTYFPTKLAPIGNYTGTFPPTFTWIAPTAASGVNGYLSGYSLEIRPYPQNPQNPAGALWRGNSNTNSIIYNGTQASLPPCSQIQLWSNFNSSDGTNNGTTITAYFGNNLPPGQTCGPSISGFNFSPSPPVLKLNGSLNVSASRSDGVPDLPVNFSSLTPSVCSVIDGGGGTDGYGNFLSPATITDLGWGACTIAANQGGNNQYGGLPQATQTLTVGRVQPINEFSLPIAPASGVPSNVPSGPFSITTGPDGNLWYTKPGANVIGVIPASGVGATEFTIPTPNSAPQVIVAGPDGNLWFVEGNGNKIGKMSPYSTATDGSEITEYFNPPTTATTTTYSGTFAASGISGTWSITASPTGTITGTGNGYPNGSSSFTITGTVSSNGLLTMSTGTTSNGASFSGSINLATGVISGTWINTSFLSGTFTGKVLGFPQSITVGPDGNLWYTDQGPIGSGGPTVKTGNGSIGRITPSGVITKFTVPTPNSEPNFITAGPDGALWYTYGNDKNVGINKIGRITTSGSVTNEYTIPTTNSGPMFIAKGSDGALWFTEEQASKIGRITTSGTVTEYPLAANTSPVAITAGPDGAMWFTEPGFQQQSVTVSGMVTTLANTGGLGGIGRITPGGDIKHIPTPTRGSNPGGIVIGQDGTPWYTDSNGNSVGHVAIPAVVTGAVRNGSNLQLIFSGPMQLISASQDPSWPSSGDLREITENVILSGSYSSNGSATPTASLAAIALNNGTPLSLSLASTIGQSTLTINNAFAAASSVGISGPVNVTITPGITNKEPNDPGPVYDPNNPLVDDYDTSNGGTQPQLGGGIEPATLAPATGNLATNMPVTLAATSGVAGAFTGAVARMVSSPTDPTRISQIVVNFTAPVALNPALGNTISLLVNKIRVAILDSLGNMVSELFPTAQQMFLSPAGGALTITLPTDLSKNNLNGLGVEYLGGVSSVPASIALISKTAASGVPVTNPADIVSGGMIPVSTPVWMALVASGVPATGVSTQSALPTQSIKGTLTNPVPGAVPNPALGTPNAAALDGSYVTAYLATWLDTSTATDLALINTVTTKVTGGTITGTSDKDAKDKVAPLEFFTTTDSSINTSGASGIHVVSTLSGQSAVPAVQNLINQANWNAQIAGKSKADSFPVYVKLIKNTVATGSASGYVTARAIMADTYANAASSEPTNAPVYEVALDSSTGSFSGTYLSGKLNVTQVKTSALKNQCTPTDGSGLMFIAPNPNHTDGDSCNNGKMVITDRPLPMATGAVAAVDGVGSYNLLLGIDPAIEQLAASQPMPVNPFVLLVHEQPVAPGICDADNISNTPPACRYGIKYTLLTSSDPKAANYLPFTPDVFNKSATITRPSNMATDLDAIKRVAPVPSNSWALYGLGNPALATTQPTAAVAAAQWPRQFVGLGHVDSNHIAPVSFWVGDGVGRDMAMTMVGGVPNIAAELGYTNLPAGGAPQYLGTTTSLTMNNVIGAAAMAWLNDSNNGNNANGDGNDELDVLQAGKVGATLTAGWSLVTIPASGTINTNTIDAIIKVGAQTASSYTWVKAADSASTPNPLLTPGEAVFVHAAGTGGALVAP